MCVCFQEKYVLLGLSYMKIEGLHTIEHEHEQQEQATEKCSEQNLAHVGMEPSKTNQTRWEWPNSTFTPSLHAHQNSHSRAFHIKGSTCVRLSSNKSSQHNWHFNMPNRCSTAHAIHSFCIQNRPHLPCLNSYYPPHCLPQPSHAHK